MHYSQTKHTRTVWGEGSSAAALTASRLLYLDGSSLLYTALESLQTGGMYPFHPQWGRDFSSHGQLHRIQMLTYTCKHTQSKVSEFLQLGATTLQSYLDTYTDSLPEEGSLESQFVLALCGTITSNDGRRKGMKLLMPLLCRCSCLSLWPWFPQQLWGGSWSGGCILQCSDRGSSRPRVVNAYKF